ncbi:MAG: beta-ketoacyl-ACP synthase II [Chloroflexota bacterium]|nr:beta-ketoacyl-ACP synthase II [Chloroflexota bacterium]
MMQGNGFRPRIVITGIGAVTPLANTWEGSWQGLTEGVSAGTRISHFDPTGFPTQIACSVQNFNGTDYMHRREARRLGKVTQFAWAAAQEAVSDSGLDMDSEDPERVGIEIGSAFGALNLLEEQAKLLNEGGPRRIKPSVAPSVLISTTPCYVAIRLGVKGPANSQVTACATGITSLGEAAHRIGRGEVDVMVAGGSDSFQSPMIMASFSRLGAMSTRNDDPKTACRPFCATRDGLIMGEGATVMILETLEHAEARGANILGEITGYALTSDAFNLAAPDPTGDGPARAMKMAMKQAGVTGADVDYISAHGTATRLNDPMETKAIKLALGDAAYDTRISSIKSMIGHTMGASGAVGSAVVVNAIRDGLIPPTINYFEVDPECDLNYVPNKAEVCQVDVGMCNGFGFGGQNASIVIRRFVP